MTGLTSSLPESYGFRGAFGRDPALREAYSAASGILGALPAAVAIPADAADLAPLLEWAHATRTPLIPRGAATGMPGGNVGSGVVVDMAALRAEPTVIPSRREASVQPGVTLHQLNKAAAAYDLSFPVDPSSGRHCTLGGMIANNAAGAHSVRYGAVRSWVRELDVVLADGSACTLRRGHEAPDPVAARLASFLHQLRLLESDVRKAWPRVRKNSSGYALTDFLDSGDAIDLIVGSEGTLAFVTGARLALTSVPPAVGLLVLEFADLNAATQAVLRLLPLRPLTCEMLDRTFLDLLHDAEEKLPYRHRPDSEALLLVEFDAQTPEALPATLENLLSATATLATRATSALRPDDVLQLWEIRHAASPIIGRLAGKRVSMQFIEDSVVPVQRLGDYVVGLRTILARHQLPAVVFGHAGDGNLHVNPLVDVTDPDWHTTLEAVLHEVLGLVVHLGGTLSGEHGDGRLRAPLLPTLWSPDILGCFVALKKALDPHGILNPGVILPLPGQRPFDLLRNPA